MSVLAIPILVISSFCIKVEAPEVDHLRNLRADGEEYEVLEIFPM